VDALHHNNNNSTSTAISPLCQKHAHARAALRRAGPRTPDPQND
jgi:hypothetical protein